MALARALAASAGLPLWQWLISDGVTPSLPVPHFNVLNGGLHATNELDFQEFMIASVGAPSMAEAVRAGAEVYAALRRELTSRKLSTGLGDEGGFAPDITAGGPGTGSPSLTARRKPRTPSSLTWPPAPAAAT